jgi:transcriptional regulator with XRE-family HTH domain
MVPSGPLTDGATNAVIARRRLARRLRRYRQRAGLSIDDLARGLECSTAKVSRMETAMSGVRIQDLAAIAALVPVDDSERRELEDLVRAARSREWWNAYTDVYPAGMGAYFGLEDGAATIRAHQTSLIPGLLQTPDYARALMGSAHDVEAQVLERRLALRRRRQLLLDRDSPPAVSLVLDEAVLRRAIGGDRALMADQWEQVLRRAEGSGVVVRILPADAPAHPAEGTTFTVFDFEDDDLTPVVFAEVLGQNLFVEEPTAVRVYLETLATVERIALPPMTSLELIRARLGELRAGG